MPGDVLNSPIRLLKLYKENFTFNRSVSNKIIEEVP